nr:FecR domain-containing protein [Stakelama sediminis]
MLAFTWDWLPLHANRSAQAPVVFASGNAQQRVIDMPDGSVVTLAADSRVDIRYTKAHRRVRLVRGEALFKVAHNKQRPFIVSAAGGSVTAVGTAFDVRLDHPSKAQVTVVEGVVKVAVASRNSESDSNLSRLARKGQQVDFGLDKTARDTQAAFITARQNANIDLTTAWTRGMLYFNGEPLSQVIDTVNRYTDQKVVLADPAKANMPIYGLITQGDTSALKNLVAQPNIIRTDTATQTGQRRQTAESGSGPQQQDGDTAP